MKIRQCKVKIAKIGGLNQDSVSVSRCESAGESRSEAAM